MTDRHFLVHKSEVPDDEIVGRTVDGREVAVCRIDGQFCAFANACTHYDWPLSEGFIHKGLVYCSLHMAAFDPKTGSCEEPPATQPLEIFRLVEEDDALYVELDVPDAAAASDVPVGACAHAGTDACPGTAAPRTRSVDASAVQALREAKRRAAAEHTDPAPRSNATSSDAATPSDASTPHAP